MYEALNWLYDVWFFPTLGVLFLLERVPLFQRKKEIALASRWPSNIGLFIFSVLAVPLLVPAGIYSFAKSQGTGLLSGFEFTLPVKIIVTFLLLDFWRYWEHRIYHHFTLLWRCHLVHHSDFELDVTTAERHHPFEVLLGLLAMMAIIWLLALPAEGVGVYLLVANANSLLSHINLKVPGWVERPLRLILVTPQVHAVHHSDFKPETNSNYGVVLTLWDYLFKTYTAPEKAKIPHFGLEYFHLPQDNQLLPVLMQPFRYHIDLKYPARESTLNPVSILPPVWQNTLKIAGIGMTLVILALWPTLTDMAYHWSHTEAYRYAWLIFPLLVYLLGWHYREELMGLTPKPTLSGLLIVIFGALMWSLSKLININVGQHTAFVVIVQGMIVSSFGWRIYRKYLPLWAMFFLLVPYGDLLQPVLRSITVRSIELFVTMIGLPHHLEGFVILVGSQSYIVIDECAGLPYFTMATFLGFSFGLLLYRSVLKILGLTLFGAFLGILSNVIRVNAIVMTDWLVGSQMALSDHGNFQWFALFIALGLLFFILNQLEVEKLPNSKPLFKVGNLNSLQKSAPVVSALVVVVMISVIYSLPLNNLHPPQLATIDIQSMTLGNWELTSTDSEWMVDHESESGVLTVAYQKDGRTLQIVVIEALDAYGKLSEAKLTPNDGSVWLHRKSNDFKSCINGAGCVKMNHTVWQNKSMEQRHIFYTYGVGSFNTDSKLLMRAAQSWGMMTDNKVRSRLIGFIFEEIPTRKDDLAELFMEIQSTLDSGNS